jgi:gamma-glutamyl-gamma-aminobutyraldehyde dehydrogenase
MTSTYETARSLADTIRPSGAAWINNQPVTDTTGGTLETFNPATGAKLADVVACGPHEVDEAVRAARAVFESGAWSRLSPSERKNKLLDFADLLDSHIEELAALEALDSGKPITDALEGDLPEAIGCIRWHAEIADKLYGELGPTGQDIVSLIVREPVGVVAAILPWNFPLVTAAWKLGPALATGNSVIIKPAALTPLSTIRLAELAAEAGLPDGVINVLPGRGSTVGQAIGLHPDIDAVTFTGSTEVGHQILRYSADSNLKSVTLECGGKSPTVVLGPIKDMEALAEHVTAAFLWNQGENCSAGTRLIVDRRIQDPVVDVVVDEAKSWKVGNPLDQDTRVGPMIERAHFDKVIGYIETGTQEGGEVLVGGGRAEIGLGGDFVAPTVLGGVSNDMTVAREEIFGPVLSVISVDSYDEAIKLANETNYGLASSIWTDDLNLAHKAARAIRAGTVSVNCFSEGDHSAPFGGFKESGFGGRDKGRHAHEQYEEIKTIWMAIR